MKNSVENEANKSWEEIALTQAYDSQPFMLCVNRTQQTLYVGHSEKYFVKLTVIPKGNATATARCSITGYVHLCE